MTVDRSILTLPLPPGWVDADEVMFQACFIVLGDFVEDELGAGDDHRGYCLHSADIEEGDPSGIPAQPSSDRTAIDLWLWYKIDLPALEAAYELDQDESWGEGELTFGEPDQHGNCLAILPERVREPKFEHDYPEIVKDQKLRELIDLRRRLWT